MGRPSKMEILAQLEQSPTPSSASSARSSSTTSSTALSRKSKMEILNQLEQLNTTAATPKMSRWDYLTSLDTKTVPAAPNLAPANAGENFYDEMPYSAIHKSKPRFYRCFQFCDCLRVVLCNKKMACLLLGVFIMTAISATLFGIASLRLQLSKPALETANVSPSSVLYMFNEDVVINVQTETPKSTYWVGLWQDGQQPRDGYFHVSDRRPAMWMDFCNDGTKEDPCPQSKTLVFSENTHWSSDYTIDWPLCNGKWVACMMDTAQARVLGCSHDFAVYGGTCDGVCKPATDGLSAIAHAQPTPHMPVSRIAFGSCFEPDNQVDHKLWSHMRDEFKAELWVWLGDTIYADGEDIQHKREVYNAAKHDPQYLGYGPLAEPKIPVAGTWDDHDSGNDNSGAEYQCHKLAQDEFAYFLNIPETDPRHPAQGEKQQKGVYSSIMFSKPTSTTSSSSSSTASSASSAGSASNNSIKTRSTTSTNTTTSAASSASPTTSNNGPNGVHLILLDVRTFRSPTFEEKGYCQGSNSTMLGEAQWEWLDEQLHESSDIKVIGTGLQVMQPTDRKFTNVNSYCANDGSGSFFDALEAVGEKDERFLGTQFEGWNQLPQEKARLMQKLQQCINDGFARKIVIISGDMHWGEMMVKEMPESKEFGASQVLYEVTASGIDKNWPYPDPNSNRLRVQSADHQGDGLYVHECKFPFTYDGQEFTECTLINEKKPWCAIAVDEEGMYVHPNWGYCQPEADALVPRVNITSYKDNACDDDLHICRARANYGGIEIDWDQSFMTLSIFTPHSSRQTAAAVRIGF